MNDFGPFVANTHTETICYGNSNDYGLSQSKRHHKKTC